MSDEDYLNAIDWAQRRFAKKARCLQETVEITVYANDAYITLPSWVLDIRTAYLQNAMDELKVRTPEQMYAMSPTWRSTTGSTGYLVPGLPQGKARLVGKPTSNDVLELFVYRGPKTPVADKRAELELTDPEHLDALRYGVAAQLYGRHDIEVYDLAASERNLARFYAEAEQARGDYKRRTRPAGNVRYQDV